jgi:hypothetical protein
MSRWLYNIIGFGGRALPTLVAGLGRYALREINHRPFST